VEVERKTFDAAGEMSAWREVGRGCKIGDRARNLGEVLLREVEEWCVVTPLGLKI